MYDIFDPKELSDDELFNRIRRAQHFISVHIDKGHDSLVHSLEITLAVMEEEQEYRALKRTEEYEAEMRKRKAKSKTKNTDSQQPSDTSDDSIIIGRIEGVDD